MDVKTSATLALRVEASRSENYANTAFLSMAFLGSKKWLFGGSTMAFWHSKTAFFRYRQYSDYDLHIRGL